jgi:CheY-like chemotaxis protein
MAGESGGDHGRVVIAAVDDLFFATKIETAAKAAGVELRTAATAEDLWRQLESLTPSLIVLDLNSARCTPLDTVVRLKADPRLSCVKVVGFLSHVQEDLQRSAQSAGCDLVIPRSVFSAKLGSLLTGGN